MPDVGGGGGIGVSIDPTGLFRGTSRSYTARGPAGVTVSGEGQAGRGLFQQLRGTFGSKPYTGGAVPAGSTVTYSNVGAYEPYRGSPNTSKKKVRRKTRAAKKWVDTRFTWEKMLDWMTQPIGGEKIYTGPLKDAPPEVREKYHQILADAALSSAVNMFQPGPSVTMPRNLAPKPTLTAIPGGAKTTPRVIGNTALKVVPKEVSMPGVSARAAPAVARAPSTILGQVAIPEPIDEVQVTATKVGSATLTQADPLDEVRVTARYFGGDLDEQWKEQLLRRGNSADQVDPRPRPASSPTSAPGRPGPVGQPAPNTGKAGRTAPVALPRLGPIKLSLDSLLSYAVGKLSRRATRTGTASQLVGPILARPGSPTQPILGQTFALSANPYAQAYPQQNPARCRCPSKKKKSSPRKARSVCWKGSYVETARGLRKTRREQVPC